MYMKLYLKICVLILFISGAQDIYSQKSKLRKAEKQYEKFAYINAQDIYLQVVENGYTSAEIFKRLGNTYYFNSDYKNAALWYDRLLKEFPNEAEAEYYFRAAQSFKSENRYAEADAIMQKLAGTGAKDLVIQNFKNDPNYLERIKSKPVNYTLEKVAINTEYTDFGPSFYGDSLVYASAAPSPKSKVRIHQWNKQPFFNLYKAAINEEGKLSNSEILSGEINTKFHESSTAFTKDGNTVYFTRNNFINGKKGKDEDENIRLKIYKASKINNEWKDIVELPFNNASYSTAHPALSPDEKRLYFSSDRPGTLGLADLWYVEILGDNKYGEPVNLGPSINTEVRETFPFISNENVLYFATNGRAGLGGLDIFYTALDTRGMPTEIIVMGEPINSNKDDFGFIVNKQRELAYLTSNRSSESNFDDIYRAIATCEIVISGLVTDEETGVLLPGTTVALFDENNLEIKQQILKDDALFRFEVDCNKSYSVRATNADYEPGEKALATPTETADIDLPLALKRIGCAPNDLGCRLTLQPIYFNFDSAIIRPDAEIELAKILAAMREYPELVIHIESHTDSRGPDDYNEKLSERRARSTMEWLVSKGISKDRLTAKGYGESRLINNCGNGSSCTEAEHQLNRRSMFIIQD